MTRSCDSCGASYESIRATSRFCTPKCRKRGSRSPTKSAPSHSVPEIVPDGLGLLATVVRELEAANVLDTVLGQLAVEIVGRVLNRAETGSAVAALTKQLRDTMTAALASSVVVVADPLDELRNRRDNKRRIG